MDRPIHANATPGNQWGGTDKPFNTSEMSMVFPRNYTRSCSVIRQTRDNHFHHILRQRTLASSSMEHPLLKSPGSHKAFTAASKVVTTAQIYKVATPARSQGFSNRARLQEPHSQAAIIQGFIAQKKTRRVGQDKSRCTQYNACIAEKRLPSPHRCPAH